MTTDIQELKMAKAHTIIAKGENITKIDNVTYTVPSQTGNWFYTVQWNESEWHCSCPDHNKRNAPCKHIYSTMLWIGIHDASKDVDEHKPMSFSPCPECGSHDFIRKGHRNTKKGRKQRFKCRVCGHRYSLAEDGFENMKFSPEIVTQCLDLYFKGVSLRKIANHIGQSHNGLEISHVQVYYWIKRYTKIISEYVDELKPELGDMWATDEMMIKVKHDGLVKQKGADAKWVWMWNVLDNETRFLIATMVSKKKKVADAKRLFKQAKDNAGKTPKYVTTDGLLVYPKAFKKEFFRKRLPRPEHIAEVGIRDRINNNRVERFHGSVRDRDKVMRAMHNPDTSTDLLEGFRAYYNFVRPHMALEGKTPAQMAGMDLKLGSNKWLDLIKRSVGDERLTETSEVTQI